MALRASSDRRSSIYPARGRPSYTRKLIVAHARSFYLLFPSAEGLRIHPKGCTIRQVNRATLPTTSSANISHKLAVDDSSVLLCVSARFVSLPVLCSLFF